MLLITISLYYWTSLEGCGYWLLFCWPIYWALPLNKQDCKFGKTVLFCSKGRYEALEPTWANDDPEFDLEMAARLPGSFCIFWHSFASPDLNCFEMLMLKREMHFCNQYLIAKTRPKSLVSRYVTNSKVISSTPIYVWIFRFDKLQSDKVQHPFIFGFQACASLGIWAKILLIYSWTFHIRHKLFHCKSIEAIFRKEALSWIFFHSWYI